MKTQAIIIGLIVVGLIFYFIWIKLINKKNEPDTNTTRPSDVYLPKHEKQNDKLVIINNATSAEIDSILVGFCNIYNKEVFQAQPRLYKINERQFAVTFPYDIEFEIYCYFINYVHYPIGFDKSFDVTGWATTQNGQRWITANSANKKVMLFIPEDDTEHDNVYLTTFDNIGYKLGFAIGEQMQLLAFPPRQFSPSEIRIEELINTGHKDYK